MPPHCLMVSGTSISTREPPPTCPSGEAGSAPTSGADCSLASEQPLLPFTGNLVLRPLKSKLYVCIIFYKSNSWGFYKNSHPLPPTVILPQRRPLSRKKKKKKKRSISFVFMFVFLNNILLFLNLHVFVSVYVVSTGTCLMRERHTFSLIHCLFSPPPLPIASPAMQRMWLS